MRRTRIACIQYQLRAIANFEQFAEQVSFFVESADDYEADFVLLPELFTTQLMSFLDEREPVNAIRHLAEYTDAFVGLMQQMASRYQLHIVAGTHPRVVDGRLYNTSFLFFPDGHFETQDKIHITPTEAEYWKVESGDTLKVFETRHGKVAIAICYDTEFPELSRKLADAGAELLFVPYCTDDRQAYVRVRTCAHARAIENQLFVATAGTVGNLPRVPYMYTNYACSAILTPSDFPFARDGIAAEGNVNQEMLVTADVDLDLLADARQGGSVRPFTDRRPEVYTGDVEVVSYTDPRGPPPDTPGQGHAGGGG
jgi:predicted amidohydrolase